MKKKIQKQLLVLAAVAILFTVVSLVFVFYHQFQRQMLWDLRSCADIIEGVLDAVPAEEKSSLLESMGQDSIRITWIDKDGNVLFDNEADVGTMADHSTRPEVRDAMEQGTGESIRVSDTMSRNMFYYARQLQDGSVLRVAAEASSAWGIFLSVTPVSILLLCVLIGICILIARFMTHSFVGEIEKMGENIEDLHENEVFPELAPFVEKIRQQHRDILKNADMRQQFTANVSHELKTPLTAISGYSELIENQMVPESEIPRFAKEIHRSANRLLTLINDIIKLSELDSIDNQVILQKQDLYQAVCQCVEQLQINAQNRNISLYVTGNTCYINANKEMLDEVIFNLCDNAIRYNNDGGSVYVSAEQTENEVILRVKDTGIGIAPRHQKHIFERFYRVDKSRSKSTGGTGLGLAIVKHIVAQHGAEMSLVSEEGKGTEITIKFMKYEEV
ncbi:MAG: ATP-binding protein [Lachnospiraceae bacterium]